MKYRHSPYEFSVDTLPISIGELDRILKNNKVAIGDLYELISPILYNTPGFRAGKYWFSLVNVTCTHTGFSYGILPPPPKPCMPLSGTWFYTFALGSSGYSESTIPIHVSHRGINATAWGNRRGNEFLTITTTHYQAEQMGIRYDMLTPFYLYFLLGAMTKNFAVRNRFYTRADTYEDLYVPHAAQMLRSQYHMMPLYKVMVNVPYHLWVFNRHIWMLGTNLLSLRHITAQSLLYVCQNIRQIQTLPPEIEVEIVDQFQESLTDLDQRQRLSEPAKETWQLLYTALVNKKDLPLKDIELWLTSREAAVAIPASGYKEHILKLLYA